MEKKTIGQFIAALRKANGMTQKQFSEMLNVSDKAVSRWERDECAPDLSLIPVIADIFGVTSDEILRGERRTGVCPEVGGEVSARSVKHIEKILKDTELKFGNRSLISAGIAVAGLLGAMLFNLGFNRAYIGFIVACVIYLAAAVCETVFVKNAFSSVDNDELSGELLGRCKKSLFSTGLLVYSVILVLFSVTLPLFLCVSDPYWGLAVGSWALLGMNYGGVAVIICVLCAIFLDRYALKRGVYSLSDKERTVAEKVYGFDKKMIVVIAAVVGLTFIVQLCFTEFATVERFAVGRVFDSVEAFVEYMETTEEEVSGYETSHISPDIYEDVIVVQDYSFIVDGEPVQIAPEGDYFLYDTESFYLDAQGNEIFAEEFLATNIYGRDGEVVASFLKKNRSVAQWDVDWDGASPIFTVYTQADFIRFYEFVNGVNSVLRTLYGVELSVLGLIWVVFRYKLKRARNDRVKKDS